MLYLFNVLSLALVTWSYAEDPISFHDLVVVEPSGNAVIKFRGYDLDGDVLKYRISQTPQTGRLNQLSQVYSSYGYEPKDGDLIKPTAVVTGSNNRVYYKRPSPDVATVNKWGTFSYTVSDAKKTSYESTITLVPPSGALVGSNFLLGDEKWKVVGNKAVSTPVTHEPYSRGPLLNHYILGADDKINVGVAGGKDESLWFFEAPSNYLGNLGIAYGGNLKFTLAAFSGDFSSLNDNANIVELDCAECVGPVGQGITLVFPLSKALASTPFKGEATAFTISLTEASGWLKDPQNTLRKWEPPSKCDLIQVLSRLSSVKILGDWTTWYETVALDNVQFYNTKSGQIPVCAMSRPDASICSC